jgi:hypothetical protein
MTVMDPNALAERKTVLMHGVRKRRLLWLPGALTNNGHSFHSLRMSLQFACGPPVL